MTFVGTTLGPDCAHGGQSMGLGPDWSEQAFAFHPLSPSLSPARLRLTRTSGTVVPGSHRPGSYNSLLSRKGLEILVIQTVSPATNQAVEERP